MAGITEGALALYAKQLALSGIPEGKTLIDIDSLDSLKADKKRVSVIDTDTIFDEVIKLVLLIHFSQRDKTVEELFDTNKHGPLVSLTHKAKLLYALGLIDEIVRKDLECIHRIRNRFAHSSGASFAETEVVKCVGKLSTAKDQTITARNSYKFYKKASNKCWTSLTATAKQEVYRLSMLVEAKKTKNSQTKKSKNNK